MGIISYKKNFGFLLPHNICSLYSLENGNCFMYFSKTMHGLVKYQLDSNCANTKWILNDDPCLNFFPLFEHVKCSHCRKTKSSYLTLNDSHNNVCFNSLIHEVVYEQIN